MFVVALAGSFADVGRESDAVTTLLDAWPTSAADGRAIASAPSAAAGVLRWAVVDRDRGVAPIWDAQRQLLFVGDVRLYNRRALVRELDVDAGADASDAEVAWKAYQRWGEDSPRHLVGDFAFVVWDERNRSLFAARDHFGVRPLYYKVDGQRTYVASDVRQLVALTRNPFGEINAQTVLEKFSGGRRTYGITYFQNISEVPAGHTISIGPNRRSVQRYWVPSFASRRGFGEDDLGEIRALFRQAVRDRLESTHPIIAHSSGGFDSSAIIMSADQIYRDEPNRPALVMASATTPGMPCDDSPYMDAVARRVQFEGVRWNPLDQQSLADIEDPVIPYPGLRRGTGGGPRRDLELARERDARVLLNGFFGDSLMFAFGISRDMFRARRWRELARHVVTGSGARARARLVARSVAGFLSPATALGILHRIENRSFDRPPAWMGPALRALYPPAPIQLVLPEVDWPSHLACELWARMASPRTGASVDTTVAYGVEQGIEVRLPYADIRLAEKLLTIPWEAWLPRNGDHRRLNRDALGPLLPREFEQRKGQGSWMPVWRLGAQRIIPAVQRFLSDGTWLSAPYVDADEARSMLADVITRADSVEHRKLLLVANFGTLEAWLRHLFRYDTARKERYV